MKKTISFKTQLIMNQVIFLLVLIVMIGLVIVSLFNQYIERELIRDNKFITSNINQQVKDHIFRPVGLMLEIGAFIKNKEDNTELDVDIYFENMISLYPYFETIKVVNKEGKVIQIIPFSQEYIGRSEVEEGYYNELGFQEGKVIWSNAYISRESGNPTSTISIGMTDFMLVTNLDLEGLNDALMYVETNEINSVSILDQYGTYLISEDILKIQNRTRHEDFDALLKLEMIDGISTKFEKDHSIKYISIIPENGWFIVTDFDADVIYASVKKTKVSLVVGCIIFLIMGLFMSYRSIVKFSGTIHTFNKQIQKLTIGDYNIINPNQGYHEVVELFDNFVLMARMIEEREEEISQLNESLNNQINKMAIVREELIIAKEGADRANESKSRFLAVMSHEIRTPMNGIIGFLQLLKYTRLTKEQKEFIDSILLSSEILTGIINDILDYTKIEVGKFKIDIISFDIKSTMEGVVNPYKVMAKEKGLKLELTMNENIPKILLSDPTKLKQIMTNLLSNAIKFTKIGSINIDVNYEKVSEDRIKLVTSVSDTGIGIEEQLIPKLFTPFIQADTSIARMYGGTGLGLSICKEIVRQMEGTIHVESIKNVGSKFEFEILMNIDNEIKAFSLQKKMIDRKLNIEAKILLVEDNIINQKVFTNTLRLSHLTCDIANNGEEAIKAFKSNSYDVIFMDCQMPILDGYRATELIRELEHGKEHVPVIALTAYAMEEDKIRAKKSGMDDFLTKPVDIVDIIEIIHRYGHGFTGNEEINFKKVEVYAEMVEPLEEKEAFIRVRTALMEASGFDFETSHDIILAFFNQAKIQLEMIIESIQTKDFEAARKTVHQLKGASSSARATSIAEVATQLEIAIKEGKLEFNDYLEQLSLLVNI